MLLGTLGARWLGNLLIGKAVMRAGESTIRAGQNFWCCIILQQILECKSIIKIKPNLMVFIQEIIYLKYLIIFHI